KGLEALRQRYTGDREGFARAFATTDIYLEIVALQIRRQHEAALAQILTDRRRLIATIEIAGALMLAVLIIGTAGYVRRSFAAVDAILEIDERQSMALRESLQQVKELSTRILETEETERRKINRELHDRIGQNLSALGLSLNLVRDR